MGSCSLCCIISKWFSGCLVSAPFKVWKRARGDLFSQEDFPLMKFQKVRTKSTISNFQNCFLNSYLAISLWTTWLSRELMELVLDRKFKAPNVKIIKFDNFRKVGALGPTQVLLLEITLFSEKASHKIEKQFRQKIWYFVKIKRFWKLMIWLCYFWKKKVFCFGCDLWRPLYCISWAKKQ